jgi:hypothetical protein
MTRTLWRLEGATTATLAEPTRLAQGLRLHLEHTQLTSVLMQLGYQQQAYIGTAGCEGCVHGRCTPGCYVELLRRLLRACFSSSTLCAVPGGLATRPYRRVALAWPTAQALPLTSLRLVAWPDARLIVQWHGTQRHTTCAALLAVGSDGPEPAVMLGKVHWRAWVLPRRLGYRLANSALPPILPFPRAWPDAPTLLWPQPSDLRGHAVSAPMHHAALDADGAQDLGTLVSHPTATASARAEGLDTF